MFSEQLVKSTHLRREKTKPWTSSSASSSDSSALLLSPASHNNSPINQLGGGGVIALNGSPFQSYGASPAIWNTQCYLPPDTGERALR